MNLDYAKNKVMEQIGVNHKFMYKGCRNQTDEFEGKVIKCFPSIFLIQTDNNIIKSFTYSDFIIKNIRILS
ncbi:MAG: hypothetical protein IJ097_00620 [Bacilli bacterium]|nr:hypothetical protein [Bacilli bacterium]